MDGDSNDVVKKIVECGCNIECSNRLTTSFVFEMDEIGSGEEDFFRSGNKLASESKEFDCFFNKSTLFF